MKKSELIKKLNEFSEEDYDVCIFDYSKNMNEADSEPISTGIYQQFEVSLEYNDAENKTSERFIGLVFENEDYPNVFEKIIKN